jgi:hypothetical protein
VEIRKRYRHTVTGTLAQSVTWSFAAATVGLTTAKFLAKAADVYAQHLANIQLRRETSAWLRLDRGIQEARRRLY